MTSPFICVIERCCLRNLPEAENVASDILDLNI